MGTPRYKDKEAHRKTLISQRNEMEIKSDVQMFKLFAHQFIISIANLRLETRRNGKKEKCC